MSKSGERFVDWSELRLPKNEMHFLIEGLFVFYQCRIVESALVHFVGKDRSLVAHKSLVKVHDDLLAVRKPSFFYTAKNEKEILDMKYAGWGIDGYIESTIARCSASFSLSDSFVSAVKQNNEKFIGWVLFAIALMGLA